MELNEVPAASIALPGQRDVESEYAAAESAPLESDVIDVRPLANPKRLRLGVPSLI
jgi:hypothetical protein